jgi:NADH-quinone oxidoreductase subunit N
MTMNIIPALPEIIFSCLIMVQMMVGVFAKNIASRGMNNIAVGALLIVLLAVLWQGPEMVTALNDFFISNAFTYYTKILVLLSGILVFILGQNYTKFEKINRFEYAIVMQFSILGMMMMISANDLISLYIGLELQSLSLYVLACFKGNSLRSSESGLKYFVLGAVASCLLLYGCSMVYGYTGGTGFSHIATAAQSLSASSQFGLIIGMVFVVSALAFKVSAVPFHMWTPDVYEGAPTSVTAFFAVAPKVAGIALFMRVMFGPFADNIGDWQMIVTILSMASMILGSVAALVQTNIKRLMAYSSIGHVGYALMGVAAGSEQGASAVLLYLTIYIFMNIGTFALILNMRVQGKAVENISDLAGLSKYSPKMAFALLILMFSMAGIPPLAGFFGKLYVLLAAIEEGLLALAIVGALASVVGAFYYLRLIKIAYFDDVIDRLDANNDKADGFILLLSVAFVTGFVFIISPLMGYASFASAALFMN